MSQKFANFYLPHREAILKFTKDWTSSKGSIDHGNDEEPVMSINEVVVPGFNDAWNENEAYFQLLEDLGVSGKSLNELIESLGLKEME